MRIIQFLKIIRKINKFFLSLFLLMIPLSSMAASEESVVSKAQQIMLQLSSASFKEKMELVEELESSDDELAAVVLSALLNGELFYSKEDKEKLFRINSLTDDQYVVISLNGQEVTEKTDAAGFKSQYKKVRTNNKLRKSIKLSLAKIMLETSQEADKKQALGQLLDALNDDIAALVSSRYEVEENESVKEKMQVLLSVHNIGSDATVEAKLAAIEFLKGRLEIPAKVALKKFYESLEGKKDNDSAKLRHETSMALKAIEGQTDFYLFTEKLFFGLSLGSVLLLAAIGLAITFGVMGVINMAHGEMIMLGAYTTYVIQLIMPNFIDYSLFVAIPAAFIVSGLVGIFIQRTVIRHLHGRPLETLLATFGISLILQQAVRTIFSPLNRQVSSPEWMSGALELNPVLSLTYNRLYILAFSLLVFIALVMIIKKTSLGLNVRAVSQNRVMAKAMGVRTELVDAMTFGLGSGVAGVAGVALSQLTNVGPNLGQAYIIDSFMVVVFGGVGNLFGTLVGSFSLGVANKFLEPATGAVLANILVLVFIILFIQKRPKGLFSQKGRAAE